MHQQINLYQPVFRKQVKVFSATTLTQIAAAVLVLLLVILAHARWTLDGMKGTTTVLQQQLDSLQGQVASLEAGYQAPDTQGLDKEIEQLQADIDQRNYLLTQFDRLATRHRSGFAGQFSVLDEQRIPGLWLEGVKVNGAGQIELRGVTLDAKLVPAYVQQLARRPDLSTSPFETLSMTRIDPDKPQLRFELRNHGETVAWR
ncbi:MAG: PilN domain-containing protein [Thiogranum sp.]